MSRIMILNAGLKGVAFARDLIQAGHDVFMYDYREGMYGLVVQGLASNSWGFRIKNVWFDTQYPNPKKHPERFQKFIINQVSKLKPDILIPVNSDEIIALYPVRREIDRFTIFPFGDHATFEMLRDKHLSYERYGKLMPRSVLWEGDVYLKATNLTSGKGIQRVNRKGQFLIQEAFDGIGVGFEALCHEGRVLYEFMHKRKREYPIHGGSSVSRVSYWHEDIARLSRELIKDAQWTGFIMVEWKLNERNRDFRLLEINPRPWGSIQLAIDSRVRFPSLAVDFFVDGLHHTAGPLAPDDGWKRFPVETRNVPADLIAGFMHLLEGDFREFGDSVALWRRFHWECFRADEPFILMITPYIGFKQLLLPFVNLLRPKKKSLS